MRAERPTNGATTTTTALRGLRYDTTLVLYSLAGEPLEPVQENQSHVPDANWNAFVLPLPPAGRRVTLADVHKAFPLGNRHHFAFRCKDGAYLDLTNPDSAVPFCGRKILARVTPLEDAPKVEYLRYDDYRDAVSSASFATVSEGTKIRASSYASSGTVEHRSHGLDDYVELESTTYESQGTKEQSVCSCGDTC